MAERGRVAPRPGARRDILPAQRRPGQLVEWRWVAVGRAAWERAGRHLRIQPAGPGAESWRPLVLLSPPGPDGALRSASSGGTKRRARLQQPKTGGADGGHGPRAGAAIRGLVGGDDRLHSEAG